MENVINKAEIENIRKDFDVKMLYLERLIDRKSRSKLLTDGGMSVCSFFGNVLVTVVDRKTEAAVYIQDADDWG